MQAHCLVSSFTWSLTYMWVSNQTAKITFIDWSVAWNWTTNNKISWEYSISGHKRIIFFLIWSLKRRGRHFRNQHGVGAGIPETGLNFKAWVVVQGIWGLGNLWCQLPLVYFSTTHENSKNPSPQEAHILFCQKACLPLFTAVPIMLIPIAAWMLAIHSCLDFWSLASNS